MDYATAPASDLGRSLRGLGVNLICRDVSVMVAFLRDVLGLAVLRADTDFALVAQDGSIFQLHSDAAFGTHPLLGLVPETPPRGAGAQFYLFGLDPVACVARADPDAVLEQPTRKPHGLIEATILSPDGYAFSPARAA